MPAANQRRPALDVRRLDTGGGFRKEAYAAQGANN
jgi:hypothetical protein